MNDVAGARMRILGGQGARYVAVGILNTAVGYGVFLVALHVLEARVPRAYLIALVLNYAVGMVHSYVWNRYWTFRARGRFSRQVPRFVAVTGVTLGLNALMLQGLVWLGMGPRLGQLLSLGLTTLVGFAGHRRFSFAAPAEEV